MGIKKMETVVIDMITSAVSPFKNIAKSLFGEKCSTNDSDNLTPKIAITTKAAVSKKEYFPINLTNH